MSTNDTASAAAAATSEEEILRKKLKPDPSTEAVLSAVRKHFYNDEPSVSIQLVKELDSYDDKNLWIRVDGTDFLAKVHNGVESRDLIRYIGKSSNSNDDNNKNDAPGDYRHSAIHLQHSIMAHLNASGITTNEPRTPSSGKSGGTPVAVVLLPVRSGEDSPAPLVLRLLGWVPGRPMSSFKTLPIECLADAGRFLGRLGTALGNLPTEHLSAARRYHQWDGKNTADLRGFVRYVTDDRKRSIVESVIDAFQTTILDNNNDNDNLFETSLIHADFNDANFLLDQDFCVSGVIDFGDSVESWSILDLSVAMAYSMLNAYGKRKRSLAAAAALLRGYHSVKPVSERDRSYLPLLIACRLSCSATLGAYSYAQNPGNEYLLLHAAPAWNALELIWGTDAERRASIQKTIGALFDRACSSNNNNNNGAVVAGDASDEQGVATAIIDCSDLDFPDPSVPDPLADSRRSSTTTTTNQTP